MKCGHKERERGRKDWEVIEQILSEKRSATQLAVYTQLIRLIRYRQMYACLCHSCITLSQVICSGTISVVSSSLGYFVCVHSVIE